LPVIAVAFAVAVAIAVALAIAVSVAIAVAVAVAVAVAITVTDKFIVIVTTCKNSLLLTELLILLCYQILSSNKLRFILELSLFLVLFAAELYNHCSCL
jgi:hypothetical protein